MSRPLRTLLFSTLYPSSVRPVHGIFVETRLRELLKSGEVETRVVAPVPWFPFTGERWGSRAAFARTPAREQRHGIDVLHPRYPLLPKIGMTTAPLALALAAVPAVRRLRREGFDFDVIDAHYFYPDGVAAALLAAFFGKPLVITARGSDVNLIGSRYRLPRRMMVWAAARAAAVVGVSRALVERMQAIGIETPSFHTLRNGVDLERFKPLPRADCRAAIGHGGSPLILSVGNLVPGKGHHVCIDAVSALRGQGADARLVVVGVGPERAALEQRARARGLAEVVHFAGMVANTELARWYSAADLLFLASSREGWPNVLLEAMACGTPVVASDVGGVPEIVCAAAAGRIVATLEASAFAAAAGALLAAGIDREAVRRHAVGFGWAPTSRAQVDLFARLSGVAGMRDLVILALLVGFCLWSLRRPWIGVMLWTLVSLMSPHVVFGYAAADWPVATAVALCTLVSLAMTKEKQNPWVGGPMGWLVAFNIWICVTLPFSLYFDESFVLWQRSMKIFLMFYVSLALITHRRQLDIFIWVVVVSIAFYGVKGGVFTILSGGNYRVWGPGGFIEGNNEVALAVVAVIPLMRYLQVQMTDRRARHAMTAAMALCVVTALGTYSRGALLGVAAMGACFWLKNGKKLHWGILIVALALAGSMLMPEAWFERMDTIKTYDGDASAQGRINAWWMAWNLAKDRPFGGGFMVWMGPVFQKYAPVPDDPHAAHSIYFQVLGEHGFFGLFLFLGIGASTWHTARGLIRAGRQDPALKWAADLGGMVQVSMIGYAVTGAFLSLAYFDLPYDVMGMAVLAQRFVRAELRATVKQRKAAVPAVAGGSWSASRR